MSQWGPQYLDKLVQSMAEERDREILLDMYNSRIPQKLLFELRLKGLEFGGVLDNWGVCYAPDETMYHRTPIRPGVHKIYYGENKYSDMVSLKKYTGKGYLNNELGLLRSTNTVVRHYSKSFVITTENEYYYLDRRRIKEDHLIIEEGPLHPMTGHRIYSLIDKGPHGLDCQHVLRMQVSETLAEYATSIDTSSMMRSDMVARYREMLRLGC